MYMYIHEVVREFFLCMYSACFELISSHQRGIPCQAPTTIYMYILKPHPLPLSPR